MARTALLCATALLVFGVAVPVRAAFPGANGRIVIQHEARAGDHTQTDLYTMRPDGSRLVRLTATPGRNEFGPAWNAAGTRIAFWRTHAPFGPGSIWVMNADGSHQRQLTHGFDARDPAWDPSGHRLVFTRGVGSDFDLWTMRASDGGGLRRLTSGPALDFEPAWSPDGTQVAFTRGSAQGDPGDIVLKNVTSGVIRRLTRTPAYDHQVTWAPGGRKLVFERDFDSSSSIYAIGAQGRGLVRLTRGHFFDTGPAVSPDGRLIAFGTDRDGTLSDLWVMRADGGRAHSVSRARDGEGFPDWQPTPHTHGR